MVMMLKVLKQGKCETFIIIGLFLACLQSGLRNTIYLSIQRTTLVTYGISCNHKPTYNFKNISWNMLWQWYFVFVHITGCAYVAFCCNFNYVSTTAIQNYTGKSKKVICIDSISLECKISLYWRIAHINILVQITDSNHLLPSQW